MPFQLESILEVTVPAREGTVPLGRILPRKLSPATFSLLLGTPVHLHPAKLHQRAWTTWGGEFSLQQRWLQLASDFQISLGDVRNLPQTQGRGHMPSKNPVMAWQPCPTAGAGGRQAALCDLPENPGSQIFPLSLASPSDELDGG